MTLLIHVSNLPHQREHAEWFLEGLSKHNIRARVTSNPSEEADIHFISGPNFAKEKCLGKKTIYLDRAYHPDHHIKTKYISEDYVSLGWLRPDGGRIFKEGTLVKRKQNRGKGTIFLADYNGVIEEADTVRLHPENKRYQEPLSKVLKKHKTAIGYWTSALYEAGLLGLEIVCKDPRNIMYEENWYKLKCDFHYSEIQSGEFWEWMISI